MSTSSRLLLSAVALTLPLVSIAQTAPAQPDAGLLPSPRASFYVGVAAASGTTASPDGFSGSPTTPTTRNKIAVLPKLTLGWQLYPRLALQISGQYAQQNDSYLFTQGEFDATGQLVSLTQGAHSFRFHSVTIPVLARYTVTGRLSRRLQLDALGGVTLVHRFTQYHSVVNITAPDPSQPPITSIDYDKAGTNVHLSLGPSLRYRLGTHLDVTADVLGNYLLNGNKTSSNGGVFNTTATRYALTGSLGLLYRFGGR